MGAIFLLKQKQTNTQLRKALPAPSRLVFSTRLQLKAVLAGVTVDHPVGYF